jgi:hypothetical protein
VTAALLALLIGVVCPSVVHSEPIAVHAGQIPLYPNNAGERRAGSLLYRGGLQLSSPDTRFGGLSDLAVSADGSEILAVSDGGRWLTARLSYSTNGDLSGLSAAELAPMLDRAGKPLADNNGDAEGLALERANDVHGPVIVSFERNVRLARYDLSRGMTARPTNIPVGDWVKPLRRNAQLEAVTLLAPDALLVFAEAKLDGEDIRGAIESYPAQARPSTRHLSIVPREPFSVTGAAKAPDGSILILERRYSLLGGVGMELRRAHAANIQEGSRVDGEVLADLSFHDTNIDNMEGVAVRHGSNRETLLYLISDNNFSPLQRTLLLMFELKR